MIDYIYQIYCNPPVSAAHVYRFNDKDEARSAAKKLAEEHGVDVDVLKVISRFKVTAIEEEATDD